MYKKGFDLLFIYFPTKIPLGLKHEQSTDMSLLCAATEFNSRIGQSCFILYELTFFFLLQLSNPHF